MTKEDKKPAAMTDKMFLHKSTTKAAVAAKSFIEAHRQFLLSGTLKKLTEPLIIKLDKGDALPTPTLEELKSAVLAHMLDVTVKQGIQQIKQHANGAEHTTTKNYLATIYNSKDEVQTYIVEGSGEVKDLVKGFDDGEHARDWCDRRLVDGLPDWYGEIVHTKLTINGEPWVATVERSDAIARIFRRKKTPTMHERGKSTKSLSFGVKAKQDRASFSKG